MMTWPFDEMDCGLLWNSSLGLETRCKLKRELGEAHWGNRLLFDQDLNSFAFYQWTQRDVHHLIHHMPLNPSPMEWQLGLIEELVAR